MNPNEPNKNIPIKFIGNFPFDYLNETSEEMYNELGEFRFLKNMVNEKAEFYDSFELKDGSVYEG